MGGDHTLQGGILVGVDGARVELQGRLQPGKAKPGKGWPGAVRMVGLAGTVVRETLQRIQGAFAKYGFAPPEGEVLVNLAPPDIPKEGTALDLPIALLLLQAAGHIPDWPAEIERRHWFVGELGLHGEIRPVRGVLPIALLMNAGDSLVLPASNQKEACLMRALPGRETCNVLPVETLAQVVEFMRGKQSLPNAGAQPIQYEPQIERGVDFAQIKGQTPAKRAMEIAAAGGHNALLVGPPGEGKSLIARALPTILPRLSQEEKVELTRIYSAKGLLASDGAVVTRRPCREVHHTTSKQALVGGGSGIPQPGEITLAHKGVLFLDELPEFSRPTIESIRQPLEGGRIHITRVGGSCEFPAEFTLVAAMNPCPCGYDGLLTCATCQAQGFAPDTTCAACGTTDLRPRCTCSPSAISQYRKRISGPILDRLDLKVDVRPLSVEEKFSTAPAESSEAIRARVEDARARQTARFAGAGVACNAFIPGGQVQKWCVLSGAALERYKQIVRDGEFSTRATDRLAKVARTIADLSRCDSIELPHLEEAAGFLRGSVLL